MKKRFGFNIPILLAAFVIIFAVVLFHTVYIRKIFRNQAYTVVKHKVYDTRDELDTLIEYSKNGVQFASFFLGQRMNIAKDRNDVVDFENLIENPKEVLNLAQKRTPFNFIDFIFPDGRDCLSKAIYGIESYNTDKEYYKRGIKGGTGIWVDYNPNFAKEILINFYTPVFVSGKVVGVLTGALGATTHFCPMIETSFFGYETPGLICDSNFRVIASTMAEIPAGSMLSDYHGILPINKLIEVGEKGGGDPFMFKSAGDEGIACIAKLKTCDAFIIQVVTPRYLSSILNDVTYRMIVVIVVIVMLFAFILTLHLYNSKKIGEKTEETHLNLISALGNSFQSIYGVDIETGKIRVYQTSGQIATPAGGRAFPTETYEENFWVYLNSNVAKEDRQNFDAISTLEKVKKVFETKSEFSFFYKILANDSLKYMQVQFLKPSFGKEFILAFKDVTEVMLPRLQAEQKLEKLVENQTTQLSILSSISRIYLTTHLIDLEKDLVVELNSCESVREYADHGKPASEQMYNIMTHVVNDDYVERVLEFTKLSTVSDRMRGKKVMSLEFVGKINGWCRASFITVDVDEEKKPLRVIFAVQVIDAEKKKEQSLIKEANTDGLTGCLNRHAYQIDKLAYVHKELDDDFVFAAMDVNGLKTINDTLGHEAGDEIIVGAANCIRKSFDSLGKIYRVGGDEFQVMFFADEEKLSQVKKEFEKTVSEWKGEIVGGLAISSGFVTKREMPYASISEIEAIADKRMYEEKSVYYVTRGVDRRGQQDAFNSLCKSYVKILKINLTTDEFSIIQMDFDEKNEMLGFNEQNSIWLRNFGESGQIHKDDLADYLEKMDINRLREYFKSGKDLFYIHYRRKIKGVYQRVMLEIIPSREYTHENQTVFLYVKNIEL